MKKRDHLQLARYWMEGVQISALYRLAFIYGSFEPDINPLTYLHGFIRKQKFHGHNYDNIMPVLIRMLKRENDKPLSFMRCYRLGKCFHYAADIFTFPHNREFTGTLKEHLSYEKDLHKCMETVMLTGQRNEFFAETSDSPAKTLAELHKKYASEIHSPRCDSEYIMRAAEMLINAYQFTYDNEEDYNENFNDYRLVYTVGQRSCYISRKFET